MGEGFAFFCWIRRYFPNFTRYQRTAFGPAVLDAWHLDHKVRR